MKKSILLVDDDETLLEVVGTVLDQHYDIRKANNGDEALIEVARERPDLVILDVMMEHLSAGFDVAHALREREETADIPIIMLTGADEIYDMKKQTGEDWIRCDRYLSKPPDPKTLLDAIEKLLGPGS